MHEFVKVNIITKIRTFYLFIQIIPKQPSYFILKKNPVILFYNVPQFRVMLQNYRLITSLIRSVTDAMTCFCSKVTLLPFLFWTIFIYRLSLNLTNINYVSPLATVDPSFHKSPLYTKNVMLNHHYL